MNEINDFLWIFNIYNNTFNIFIYKNIWKNLTFLKVIK